MSGDADDEINISADVNEESETKNQNNEEGISTNTGGKLSVQVITKYMCRYCARQFDSPTEMQAHIATHARGKSNTQCHTCYVCGKTYSTPSKLQRHVRVHSGERPYSCNICGRRFTRSDHVKQHLKVHMPQKQRNTCRVCGMKFLRRQALHSHLQQSHGVSQVYTCHRCGEAFDRVEKLHQHKNSHLNADAQADVPLVMEGGILVKKEPAKNISNQDESSNYVVGLAKFSLGPQPQIYEEISRGHSSVTIAGGESSNNMEVYQEDMEDNSVDMNNEGGATNSECNMEISSCYSLADNSTKIKTENFEDGNPSTVTDGEQMYILTPDNIHAKVKQEKTRR
ncbi:hypothetical protein KUTeg_000207 [Tegillarca granosa]|uniref:C2H2-type domain-containing protein n=1 Tax=Tegillarca granosa TaxID=220873 RepID=A0ABQ9FYA0_TEGGR|nr:hypothetical protein KUTeg_000207 [Tegillarca granosa]